jgi:hypothetical protein
MHTSTVLLYIDYPIVEGRRQILETRAICRAALPMSARDRFSGSTGC